MIQNSANGLCRFRAGSGAATSVIGAASGAGWSSAGGTQYPDSAPRARGLAGVRGRNRVRNIDRPLGVFPRGRPCPSCHREAHMHRFTAISASILLVATGVAAAQTTTPTQPGPAAPNSAAKTPCAPSGGNGGTVGSGENLSDKLAGSNGVICPPNNVDQDMQKPA